MALIGKIRSNMWLVFVIIALATLSFILMDAQGPGGGAVSDTTMGVINGRKIDYKDFDNTERTLFSNSTQDPLMRRAGLWDYFVNKAIVENESEKIGLGVSKNELIELQFGQNLSPIIFQNYRNPQTGQVDMQQLAQIKNAILNNEEMQPGFRNYWAEQEKQVISTQLQTKINTIVQKGLYTPTWMAEESYVVQNGSMDIEVVKIAFDNISAEGVEVTDADYTSYIGERKANYTRKEETRTVDYVVMDVMPNAQDSIVWRNQINDAIATFRTTDNDSVFAISNNGAYQNYYAKSEEMQEIVRNTVPSMRIGEVFGPYISGRNYQAVKLLDSGLVPDSVSASHILLRVAPGNVTQLNRANELVDSLQAVISRGSRFSAMAEQFSEDLSNKEVGGDLGTFTQGTMLPEFNDVCFLSGRTNGVYKVTTQFGIHLLKITDRIYNDRNKKYKLAYINKAIIPTKETQDALYDSMTDLVGSYSYLADLRSKVDEIANLTMVTSNELGANEYNINGIGGGNTTRDIVKFAFRNDVELNELSPEVFTYTDEALYYNNKYVIAGLSSIREPGLFSAAEVKDQLATAVMNQKKAKKYISSLSSTDLSAVASGAGVEIDTIISASLANSFVAGLGSEPKVMGAASNLADGATSSAIIGNSGVFVVKKIRNNAAGEASGLVGIKSSLTAQDKADKTFKLIEAIKEKSKIKDNRATFF